MNGHRRNSLRRGGRRKRQANVGTGSGEEQWKLAEEGIDGKPVREGVGCHVPLLRVLQGKRRSDPFLNQHSFFFRVGQMKTHSPASAEEH